MCLVVFWLFGVAFGCSLICSCCFKLFGIVQVVRLFPFVFGSAKLAALILVVLVLSVVFVCSGLFFTIFSYLNLKYIYFVFEVLRKFGFLKLFS